MCDNPPCDENCVMTERSDVRRCSCDPAWMNFARNMSTYKMDMNSIGNVSGTVPISRGAFDGPRGIHGSFFQPLQWRTPTYDSMPFLSLADLEAMNPRPVVVVAPPATSATEMAKKESGATKMEGFDKTEPGKTEPGKVVVELVPMKPAAPTQESVMSRMYMRSMTDKFIALLILVLIVVIIIALYRQYNQ